MATYRRIDVTMVDGVYVVRFLGKWIARPQEVSDFGRDMREMLHEDVSRLLVDFSNIHCFTSAAANQLLLADRHVRARREKLRVCCVELGTLVLFRSMHLVTDDAATLFDYVETFEEALAKPWLGSATVA